MLLEFGVCGQIQSGQTECRQPGHRCLVQGWAYDSSQAKETGSWDFYLGTLGKSLFPSTEIDSDKVRYAGPVYHEARPSRSLIGKVPLASFALLWPPEPRFEPSVRLRLVQVPAYTALRGDCS